MLALRERYSRTLGVLWDLATEVSAQSRNEASSLALNSKVLPQGRYIARASGAERKPRVVGKISNQEAFDGQVYVRPNGVSYYSRNWGNHGDVTVLQKARESTAKSFDGEGGAPMFALLYGAPGCGKTALVEAAFGEDVYTLMGTGDTEVADLVGGYVQTPAGGFEWIDGDLVKAAENGGVYFIDEIGLIDPKVLSIVYGLMDGRRELTITANPERGKVKANSNFYVIAATNPNAPGVRLSEALLSRFTVQTEMGTDWDLARKLGVPTKIVTVASNLARKLLTGEVSWAPQMRELEAFRDTETVFGTEFAIRNLLASSPEIDRPVVTDIVTRTYGEEYKPAKI
jgi:nitric oxide reductase NorQ protein